MAPPADPPGAPAPAPVEVVTVGHAIVDVLVPVDDSLVRDLGLAKGTMTLVDDARAGEIHSALGGGTTVSGGSAANTAVGVSSLGAAAAFIGKVADDELGAEFARDIRATGVDFAVPAGRSGPGTGRCMIMVTPDAEKTMCTSLGIGDLLEVPDVDADLVARARVVYLEGYLCGLVSTDATVESVLTTARASGTVVALSLSDPFWVELHGDALDGLLNRVDIVFANEQEACGLTGRSRVHDALAVLADRCPTAVVTRGADGVMVAAGGDTFALPAVSVAEVVDTTGAGDMYAAGYLFGHVRGYGAEHCARLGLLAAAEIVTHFGARPERPLIDLAARAGLG